MLNKIPSLMPLKVLMIGTYEGMKEVHYKIKAEFNLKEFDVVKITTEKEKILNPPNKIEALDPKKVKGKQVIEESQQNQEELKELSKIAFLFINIEKIFLEFRAFLKNFLKHIFKIKLKYSFPEVKTDEQIHNEIKLGIRQDVFREPEEVDPKKAKIKCPIKEESEERFKYKTIQPSWYIVIGIP